MKNKIENIIKWKKKKNGGEVYSPLIPSAIDNRVGNIEQKWRERERGKTLERDEGEKI